MMAAVGRPEERRVTTRGGAALSSPLVTTTATQLGDLPEECLALAIVLTSPRDASRCAAADSDHVWQRFIPTDGHFLLMSPAAKKKKKKDAYLGLCDAAGAAVDGGCRVWLDRATGAKCYALSARRLSLPWDDGEFSWKFTPHPRSRFGEVAELIECTCLDIYGRLPASALTPAMPYIRGVPGLRHSARGAPPRPQLTGPGDSGGVAATRHAVCLRPDDAGAGSVASGKEREEKVRRPRRRRDGWWEMEMGRLIVSAAVGEGGEEVVANLEALGWYPKRGLVLHGIEFRPIH
ncbi:unnamed protein product [Urochloa decumbens]|uniref:Uncharacterized protein n=1 Tax=Urochloa decumbens TaxID=240449 RepID=A0ABC9B8F0_9POAL